MAGMFKLLIADDEGKTTVVPLVRDEVTIGRKEGNTIRLTERNVSRKHARLRKVSGAFHVSDLKSFNGVKINGRRIEAETELKPGDQISIGDYQISLQFEGAEAQDTAPTAITAMPEGAAPDVPTAIVAAPYRETGPPARLVMLSAPAPGAEFALTQPIVRIGRAEDLEVWVNHRSISREHAKVTVENGKTFIEDLGSANGVRVNGVDTRHGPIQAGDMVELGQVRFRMVGAGEAFHFDAERTMQLAALPNMAAPPPNRTPLYIALGIVGAAVLGGVGVVLSGGGDNPETTATALPNTAQPSIPGAEIPAAPVPVPTAAPAPVLGASAVAEASACQLSLNSGSFADAIMHADAALRLAPGDANATRCREAALVARGEDEIFLAGQAAVRQADWRGAVEAFGRLPSVSGYRTRPEVAQAEGEYSRLLLSQARTATDPAEARGFADEVLSMASISPAVRAEATAIQRRAPRAVAAAPTRPRPGQPQTPVSPTRPANPVRPPPPGRETNVTPPVQQAVSQASDVPSDPAEEARVCLANGDNQCVIRVLGGGRARNARALGMLAQAQREANGPASCCTTVSTLLERYGTSSEAGRWRQFHTSTCQ